MLKSLKIGCFKQNYCISGMPKGIPIQFLHNSGESQVTVTSLHIFTVVCCKFYYFKNFNTWKMLKMLKIDCFKQNYCISGMPKGIPMQFFAQQ